MKQKNQNEKTFDFIEVNGQGTVATTNGLMEVFVHGYFSMWRWSFMVHRDVKFPEYFAVSEASTGRNITGDVYATLEDALHFAVATIREKHYYFATSIGEALNGSRTNLLFRNTTCLQTIGVDILC